MNTGGRERGSWTEREEDEKQRHERDGGPVATIRRKLADNYTHVMRGGGGGWEKGSSISTRFQPFHFNTPYIYIYTHVDPRSQALTKTHFKCFYLKELLSYVVRPMMVATPLEFKLKHA